MMLRVLPIAFVLFLSLSPFAGGQPTGGDEYVVRPTEGRSTFPIAVPPFESQGSERLDTPLLSETIMNDLVLSGYFRPPDNERFARETNLLDRQQGIIHFAEWSRIGVSYLVKGSYEIQGDELIVEVKTYDVISRNYVFGQRYLKYKVSEARSLAHRISDDVIERLLGVPGIASTQIAFVRQLDPLGKTKQLTIMDADGHNIRSITGQGELTATPCWGARGTELYYTTYLDYNPDLAGVILQTGETWWISRRTGFNLSPAWSETRKLIALTLTKDNNSELYTMTRAGQELQRLTYDKSIDSSPSWSPDGRSIAFTSDRTGTPQIYVMDVASGDVRRLTYGLRYCDAAVWSPAGVDERIAFTARVEGNFQIFTIKPNGSDMVQLTRGPHNNEDPTWAPNGQVIAFTSNRTGTRQIHTCFALDGSNVQQLTSGGAQCQSSAWSPFAQ